MTVLSSLSNSPVAPPSAGRTRAANGRGVHPIRGSAETPLLAFLGLGLFCWIFLTNSLPAKRELGGRLAQVERYTADGGQLARLREELAEEEGLARAVREDAVVRRALFLLEHPTAPENAPENLLTSLSMNLPAEPETLVEEEPPIEEFELPADEEVPNDALPESGEEVAVPMSQTGARTPASNAAEPPPTSSQLEAARDARRTAARTATDKEKNKDDAKVGPTRSGAEREKQKAASAVENASKKPAPGTAAKNSKSEDSKDKAPRNPAKTPARKNSPNAATSTGPRPPGSFEVPSFLRG
ncbi:MAG: hypothetical protein JNM84_19605 [Planctomycetes bacterium]|nr:hypothetical protein [Planctomycetota bacterium]